MPEQASPNLQAIVQTKEFAQSGLYGLRVGPASGNQASRAHPCIPSTARRPGFDQQLLCQVSPHVWAKGLLIIASLVFRRNVLRLFWLDTKDLGNLDYHREHK